MNTYMKLSLRTGEEIFNSFLEKVNSESPIREGSSMTWGDLKHYFNQWNEGYWEDEAPELQLLSVIIPGTYFVLDVEGDYGDYQLHATRGISKYLDLEYPEFDLEHNFHNEGAGI